MLALAQQVVPGVATSCKSILDVVEEKWDTIHSHGVLEHFDQEDVKTIIKNQLAAAEVLVHYVPGNKHKTPSFGDERLLSLDEWKKMVRPTHAFAFNDDHDYVLIWNK